MFGVKIEIVNADNEARAVWVWALKAPEAWRSERSGLYLLRRVIGGAHPMGPQ